MLAFPIRLKSFADFRRFVNLLDRAGFSGVVVGDNFRVEADDILDLLSRYPLDNLYLVLEEPDDQERTAKRDLLVSGILDTQRELYRIAV